jgi:hypothetical protein
VMWHGFARLTSGACYAKDDEDLGRTLICVFGAN